MTYAATSDYVEFIHGKTYDSDVDEPRWTNHIARAQAFVDMYCNRTFEAANDGVVGDSDNPVTRYFDYTVDVEKDILFLDKDICEISSIKYGDSDGSTLTTAQYITNPRNEAPYHAIRILDSANINWTYDSDTASGIEVAGIWAYSKTAPELIKQAVLLMADYWEKRRTSPVEFTGAAITDGGVVVLGVRIPQDAKDILDMYRRVRLI